MTEPDLLEDIIPGVNPATKNLRFVNWIVDIIGYYIFVFVVVYILARIAPDVVNSVLGYDSDSKLMQYVFAYLFFFIYFTLLEGFTKGKTLGKFITGTRAVKEDGSAITFIDAIKRSLSRMVPFEPFSGFGDSIWHDKWTNTIVIKENRS